MAGTYIRIISFQPRARLPQGTHRLAVQQVQAQQRHYGAVSHGPDIQEPRDALGDLQRLQV